MPQGKSSKALYKLKESWDGGPSEANTKNLTELLVGDLAIELQKKRDT